MIDPRISLAIQGPSLAPGSQVINTFQNALNQAQNRRGNQQVIDQNEITNPLNAQILQEKANQAPIQSQLLQQRQVAGEQQAGVDIENRTLQLVSEFGNVVKPVLESGNTEQALSMFANHIEDLRAKGLPTQGAERIMQQLQEGNSQSVIGAIDAVQQNARGRGLLGTGLTAGQREFESLTTGLSKDDKAKAARIKLRLDPGASLTGQERIALNNELGEKVVKQLEAEAGAKEGGKLKQQIKHKPTITKAVKLAEKQATERGEVLTDLARMEAGLPGLKDAVSQLKELSAIATSTIGGKIFDAAVKQTGFGATKGATARAKMVAIITNQTLPLLRETFGSAFTETEGKRLEASFADPDATHEERLAQLDAFINQKVRTIETKQRQLDAGEVQEVTSQFTEGQTATGPNGEKITFKNGQWVGL